MIKLRLTVDGNERYYIHKKESFFSDWEYLDSFYDLSGKGKEYTESRGIKFMEEYKANFNERKERDKKSRERTILKIMEF